VAQITSLAVAHERRNLDYARQEWPGLGGSVSQGTRADAAAWSRGYSDGNKVSIGGVNRLGSSPRGRLGSG
jgi:hypothetical protein